MYLFSQFACTTVYGPPQKCCVHCITEQQEKGQHLILECLWDSSTVWQGKSKKLFSFLFFYNAEKQLCEGVFFFFLVSHYHVVSSLPSSVPCKLPQVAWAVAVHWCLWGRQLPK